MKTLVVDHTDLDGCGCLVVLRYLQILFDSIVFWDYGSLDDEANIQKMLEYDNIVFTDFSPSKEVYDTLVKNEKTILVIDHHESSEWLKAETYPKLTVYHDKTKSGTALVFEYFKGKNRYRKSLTHFINLTNCYDLFKEDDPLWPEAQNLNRVLWQCISWNNEANKFSFIADYWLNKLEKSDVWSWSKFELEKIERALTVENEEFIKSRASFKIYEDEHSVKYGITVASKKVSIIANRLLREFPDIAYCAIINTYDGWNKISLRSRANEDFECTTIGEGHKNAAGFGVEPEIAKKLYKGEIRMPYKVVQGV